VPLNTSSFLDLTLHSIHLCDFAAIERFQITAEIMSSRLASNVL